MVAANAQTIADLHEIFGVPGSDAPACLCLGKHRIVIAQFSLPGVPLPWVTESGGTVCSPLKALFSQWIPDFPRAGAGLWAVLWDLGVRYCSPGPGGCFPFRVAVGPPGGGSCAGSEVSARLFPNSQTIGNLGIAIPKVHIRQSASIPGMQGNPSCVRGGRFVRPPLGLQFPRGKRNPEGGGLRYAPARSAAGSAGPAWPFLPLPEIFSALCVQVAHGQ